MKEIQKNSEVVGFLERIFRSLNKDRFGGELETPIITVQGTPRAYGHCTCSRTWKNANRGQEQYEINIAAGTLNRPIENVVATMLHEMVHLYNLTHDIQDTSRGNAYHNKRFKAKAEEVGLVIDFDARIGWSVTSPSPELVEYVAAQGWEDIPLSRGDLVEARRKVKKPSSTRKYECPACGLSVRATRDVRIICAECSEVMQKCE